MPISEGIYKCHSCHEKFNAKSDRFYSCSCGESEIKPHDSFYAGYSYQNGNRVEVIEGRTYYLPDEFEPLSEKGQSILNEIKLIADQSKNTYFVRESTEKGENGERFLSSIYINLDESQSLYSSGVNTLSLDLNLCRGNYAVSSRIEERLARFLSFMKQMEDGSLDLSKTSQMTKLAEDHGLGESQQQVQEYNYTFHV